VYCSVAGVPVVFAAGFRTFAAAVAGFRPVFVAVAIFFMFFN
jgi:hypothetical protein